MTDPARKRHECLSFLAEITRDVYRSCRPGPNPTFARPAALRIQTRVAAFGGSNPTTMTPWPLHRRLCSDRCADRVNRSHRAGTPHRARIAHPPRWAHRLLLSRRHEGERRPTMCWAIEFPLLDVLAVRRRHRDALSDTARCSAACVLSPNGAPGRASRATRRFRRTCACCASSWTPRPPRSRIRTTACARRSCATLPGNLVPASWKTRWTGWRRRCARPARVMAPMRLACSAAARLTNEKAYLPAASSRARRALAPRTSTTTAASACRRRPRPMKAFGIDRGLPFPLDDIAGAQTVLLIGSNIAGDDAAGDALSRAPPPRRRRADRRRSAPHRDGAVGDACI